jgi:hypothetical protein
MSDRLYAMKTALVWDTNGNMDEDDDGDEDDGDENDDFIGPGWCDPPA